jgi:putative transposase
MVIYPNEYFHIYNQGNNRERIFIENDNYVFFLEKVERFILPVADVLAYCLMPNHFHFLVRTNQESCKKLKAGSLELSALSNGFRMLQSSYAQAINKGYGRSGSLFRQKTKMKLLTDENHIITCFHYIHQNPLKAGLVHKIEQWTHSSFLGYLKEGKASICERQVMESMIAFNEESFYNESYQCLDDGMVQKLYDLKKASDGS